MNAIAIAEAPTLESVLTQAWQEALIGDDEMPAVATEATKSVGVQPRAPAPINKFSAKRAFRRMVAAAGRQKLWRESDDGSRAWRTRSRAVR